MHFRTRGKVVQVIRTTYDSETQRAKTQLLGSIKKGAPDIDDELRLSCTPDEFLEVQAWVQNELTARRIEHELAARTLVDQIEKYGIPNQNAPHCSRELKKQPIKSYARSIGWKNYQTALGIRSDEPKRLNWVAKKKYMQKSLFVQ